MLRKRLFLIMGNLNMVSGNADKAKSFYKSAIDLRSRHALAYLNYSVLLMQEGDNKTAKDLLERGLVYNRRRIFKRKSRTITEKNLLLSLGTCLWLLGDFAGAIERLETLRTKYAYVNAGVLTTLGYVYLLNGDIDLAEETTQLALKDDPSFASAWDNLGQISMARGSYDSAKEAFLKAVETRELPDSLYFLGVLAMDAGNAGEARDWFLRASKSNISAFNTVTRGQIEEKLNELE
jgi:tetratricopeptide (TPR) repeat protein